MKQKDIALIIVVVFISAVLSFVISKAVFPAKARQEPVEVVSAITSQFSTPDPRYFNSDAVNPTQIIKIQDNSNTAPFNAVSQ